MMSLILRNLKISDKTLPFVLYQGKWSWRYPTNLLDLIEDGKYFEEYLPSFTFLLIDQTGYSERDFRGGVKGRIARLLMWTAFRKGRFLRALDVLRGLFGQLQGELGIDYLKLFIRYILLTNEDLSISDIKKIIVTTHNALREHRVLNQRNCA